MIRRNDSTGPSRVGSNGTLDISIVIVSWNTQADLMRCLESVRQAASEVSLEAVVVDNGSVDGSAESVRQNFPELRVIENRGNAGFARANNQALPHCVGRYILMLNPDTIINAEALRGLVAFMDAQPDAGAAGLQLEDEQGRLRNSYDNFPCLSTELVNKHFLRMVFPRRYPSKRSVPSTPIEVDLVIGACLIVREELLRRLCGFDEDYFLFVEEADLCWRIRAAGWKVYHLPNLRIVHGTHSSQAQAPELASLESNRSTHRFFSKTLSRNPRAARYAARVFRTLKATKIVGIGVPLSLIASVCTLGMIPRHLRRLKRHSLLALWHLVGCPDSWGIRLVSPYRGYRRTRSRRGTNVHERIVSAQAGEALGRFLDDPESEIERLGSAVDVVEREPGRSTYRITFDEAPPFDLVGGLRGAESLRDGFTVFLVFYGRSSERIGSRESFLDVPSGVRDFERGIRLWDRGAEGLALAGCGHESSWGRERSSFVAYFLEPGATEPPYRVLADRVLADRVLADRVLADRVLADRVLADGPEGVRPGVQPGLRSELGIRQTTVETLEGERSRT